MKGTLRSCQGSKALFFVRPENTEVLLNKIIIESASIPDHIDFVCGGVNTTRAKFVRNISDTSYEYKLWENDEGFPVFLMMFAAAAIEVHWNGPAMAENPSCEYFTRHDPKYDDLKDVSGYALLGITRVIQLVLNRPLLFAQPVVFRDRLMNVRFRQGFAFIQQVAHLDEDNGKREWGGDFMCLGTGAFHQKD